MIVTHYVRGAEATVTACGLKLESGEVAAYATEVHNLTDDRFFSSCVDCWRVIDIWQAEIDARMKARYARLKRS